MSDDWRPIATAPKDGTQILVWSSSGVSIAYWNTRPSVWEGENAPCWTVFEPDDHFYAVHLIDKPPTHWMPLPGAPA